MGDVSRAAGQSHSCHDRLDRHEVVLLEKAFARLAAI